jgi:hypothetical protein
MSPPTCVKELQAFMGMINFYQRFFLYIDTALLPLKDAIKAIGQWATPISWRTPQQVAFMAAKQALCRATNLAHPDLSAQLSINLDASQPTLVECCNNDAVARLDGSPWISFPTS